ncbi:MAG TPA: aspartate aminotransferase family protein [Armatimonadota bacterium]|jgi:4-aminobutyrate aminotransferase
MSRITNVSTPLPGPKGAALLAEWHQYEANCVGYQAPVVWDHAQGCVVTDVDGNTYLDWTSGVLVTNVGHCHPHLVEAVRQQAGRLLNNYECPTAERISAAKMMVETTPANLDRTFFMSTGSEATEAAMRVAKRYTGNFEIISFTGGFHGRTYAAAAAGGLAGPKRQYGPIMPGVIKTLYPYCYRCPLGKTCDNCSMECFDLMESLVLASSTGSLAGLIIEPYQGAAGFIFPPEGFLPRLEAWARERGIIFILDEVQSSYGRTGKMYAAEWEDLHPHLMSVGKGIGSGIPVSALMAEAEVIGALQPGEMSSTAGGNPVSSAAVIAVLEIIAKENLVENSRRLGEIMKARLLEIQQKCPYLGDVRGRGLIVGLEFVKDQQTKEPAPELIRQIIDRAAQAGVLCGSVGIYGNVLRVAPPLVITEDELHESLDIMEEVLTNLSV